MDCSINTETLKILFRITHRASEMTHRVKVISAKTDVLTLNLGTHVVEKESLQHSQIVL